MAGAREPIEHSPSENDDHTPAAATSRPAPPPRRRSAARELPTGPTCRSCFVALPLTADECGVCGAPAS